MKIIDHLKPAEPEKPIELVACLQAQRNKSNEKYFHESAHFRLNVYDSVERVGKHVDTTGDFDIIVCRNVESDNLFLGHWNSGKVNV